ncbi:hypothetical protein Rumeso_02388 [Rubellimicrobium mesophilum DSM 19309]|uniref:Uncharacterized protein n=1 Tax=Rubellimicrobium mesophilum DSM 19309 TaxID=442562 RepID=A0A017HQB4_9RHOB|nr:hypothetical protein Rumeso_02388 [Rubellimicrobium mesophilum DSM 19309]
MAGWFSYADGHATGGDLLARDVLLDWLREQDMPADVAVAPPFEDGLPLSDVDPAIYSHAFFVCGPFNHGALERDFLLRFAHCRLVGLNLSLERPPSQWNPFDLVIERDSAEGVNADMVFASRATLPPVVGVCLVEAHDEADTDAAHRAIGALLDRHEAARVAIDTRLDQNEMGLRTPGEIEALIARVDILVTTRLHGLVMGLKRGVPVLAVDAVRGGGKITRQCRHIGWPHVLGLSDLSPERLDQVFEALRTREAQELAMLRGRRAANDAEAIRDRLVEALLPGGAIERAYAQRQSGAGMAAFLAGLPPPPQPEPPPRGLRSRLARYLHGVHGIAGT